MFKISGRIIEWSEAPMVNVKPVQLGTNTRMSFAKINEVLEMPNLIEVQKDSYQWFLDEGLNEVFEDISPIADYSGKLSLEFIGFTCVRKKENIPSKNARREMPPMPHH